MAEGILTLNPITPERDPDQLGRPGYIEAPLGAGIGLALANMFKKRGIGDNNPPSPIEEEKPPQKEPPKGPDIGEEILTNTCNKRSEKKIKDKENQKSLTTQNFLDDDLMNDLLKIRGGIKGFQENMLVIFLKCQTLQKILWKQNYRKNYLININ
jgi:hypothetical protein